MVKVVFKEDNLNFSSIDTSHFLHRNLADIFLVIINMYMDSHISQYQKFR